MDALFHTIHFQVAFGMKRKKTRWADMPVIPAQRVGRKPSVIYLCLL
jgi:hypothetical protein